MSPRLVALGLFALLRVLPSTAQVVGAPRILADRTVGDPSYPTGSNPAGFVVAGPNMYFVATDVPHGAELWATDGTPAGTRIVSDGISPGPDAAAWAGSLGPGAALGSQLLFPSFPNWVEYELAVTDGSPAGTRILEQVPGPDGLRASNLRTAGSFVYFAGGLIDGDSVPWRSDGTAAGTISLVDPGAGPPPTDPWGFTEVNGRVVFVASTPATGRELFVSDGTPSGTRLLAELLPGPESPVYWSELFCPLDNVLVFAADLPGGTSLWRTDGTAGGTWLVSAGPATGFARAGALACFNRGQELWRTDGTAAGTLQLPAALAGPPWAPAGSTLASLGDRVVFVALEWTGPPASFDARLWVSDGTAAGTGPIHATPPPYSAPAGLVSDAGRVWFHAVDGAGRELWVTDGTEAGTRRVADIEPGSGSVLDENWPGPTPGLGLAFFEACTASTGCEPWVTDGTPAGTRLLVDILQEQPQWAPRRFVNAQGRALFAERADRVAWSTDGTPGGTHAIAGTGLDWDLRSWLATDGASVLMSAYLAGSGEEPWTSEQMPDDAIQHELNPAGSGAGRRAVRQGRRILLATNDGTTGSELGAWDGSAFTPVADLVPGSAGSSPQLLGRAGGLSILAASTPATGRELFVSDGSAAGTRLLADLTPGPAGSWINGVAIEHGGRLVFQAAGAVSGTWVTDGTRRGTVLLTSAELLESPRAAIGTQPGDGAAVGGRLALALWDPDHGIEPWVTDLTPAGTRLLADIVPGPPGSWPSELTSIGTRILFSAGDANSGIELWQTDLDPAGTSMLVDIAPGPTSSCPRDLVALTPDGPVVFAAYSPAGGREPWISDGTPAGTVQLPEVVPGPLSAQLSGFTAAGLHVVFSADSGTGQEPHAYDLAWAPEAGNCANGEDDDLDGSVDCADPDCASTEACIPLEPVVDTDGDGVGDDADCAPADPGAHHVPQEIARLAVTRAAGSPDPVLAWSDESPFAGVALRHDVAGGLLADLRAGIGRPCLATGVAGLSWTDAGAPPLRWYLVRAVNACGPPVGEGWGYDSFGRPERGCP